MAKSSNVHTLTAVIIIILVVSFLYVWQWIQIVRLGYKMRDADKEIAKLQEENTVLAFKISKIVSPQNIKKRAEELGLELNSPEEQQIIRVN